MHVMHLTENKRLETSNEEEREFAKWLLEVGHGSNSSPDGMVQLPDSMRCGNTIESLINALYSDISVMNPTTNNDQFFLERSILSPRNDDVDSVNQSVLDKFPGAEVMAYSSDSVQMEGGADGTGFQYPTEYLNTINASPELFLNGFQDMFWRFVCWEVK